MTDELKKYADIIKRYSKNTYADMKRPPRGNLKYPFIVPGSQSYNSCLWDWDSWLTDIGVRQIMKDNNSADDSFVDCEKGCILNFLEHIQPDGRIPIVITHNTVMPDMSDGKETNIHKPCLVQHIKFIIEENGGDCEWIRDFFPDLERFILYYMNFCRHKETGLYFWIDDMAIGVDNDPCTFFRPRKSSASVYLNSLMYKELKAMVYVCEALEKDASLYREEKSRLKRSMREHLWDKRNGFYYSADLNLLPIDRGNTGLHSGMPRHWDCLIQRIDVWSGFLAMWAGIATSEQAERIVKENMMNKQSFNAKYGIRTLSKQEKMYKIVKSGNPSCWLGPVWIISNYMCFKGLVDYGFSEEAASLAGKTIRLLGRDIEKCGEMHEYYHPDTGVGINNQGFQNWNLLVNNMIAYLENR